MRFPLRARSAVVVALFCWSCGSSDRSRHVAQEAGGGDAGPGTGGAPATGGTGGAPATGGTGGAATGGESGTGGATGTGGADASAPADGSVPDAAPDVVAPNPLDRWADPVSGLDTNDGTSAATAYRTIDKAIADVAGGGTLWLLDGTFSPASGEPANSGYNAFTVADGAAVRAVHPGAVTIGTPASAPPGFTFAGSGTLSGVHFDGLAVPVHASQGTVTLTGLTFANAGGGCSSFDIAALDLSGTAVVTLDAGAVTDVVSAGATVKGFASVRDAAELTLKGGTLAGLASQTCSPSAQFNISGTAKVHLEGVTLKDLPAQNRFATITLHGSSEVSLTDTVMDAGPAAAILADGAGTQKITLLRSTIQNFTLDPAAINHTTGAGILLGAEDGGGTPAVSVTDSTFANNVYGIAVNPWYGANAAITVTNTDFTGHSGSAILMAHGSSLSVSGGTISANASSGGAIAANAIETYSVKLRGVTVKDNPVTSYGAVYLVGNAQSSFDLGTVADAGNNVFTGNALTSVRLTTAATVTTFAVGNQWNGSVQSASAAGSYTASGAGATLEVTTGTGTNYALDAGSGPLRLAENP